MVEADHAPMEFRTDLLQHGIVEFKKAREYRQLADDFGGVMAMALLDVANAYERYGISKMRKASG